MMNYRIDPASGALMLRHRENDVLTIPAGGTFAISHDGPILMKHGPAVRVREHADKHRNALRAISPEAGLDPAAITVVEIEVSRISPAVLEEINACLGISGRVESFSERLARIVAAETREAEPDQLPSP